MPSSIVTLSLPQPVPRPGPTSGLRIKAKVNCAGSAAWLRRYPLAGLYKCEPDRPASPLLALLAAVTTASSSAMDAVVMCDGSGRPAAERKALCDPTEHPEQAARSGRACTGRVWPGEGVQTARMGAVGAVGQRRGQVTGAGWARERTGSGGPGRAGRLGIEEHLDGSVRHEVLPSDHATHSVL